MALPTSAVQLLANLAKAEVELENLLGVKRAQNYPPERPILRGDVRAQAEQDATELRHRLGLGISPVPDIVTLLELELGVRVYVRRFDGKISGLYAYDEALGPCILLNANHPRERRTQTAAHETGHLISARREPEILITTNPKTRARKNTPAFRQVVSDTSARRDAEIPRGDCRFRPPHPPAYHRARALFWRIARSDGAQARRAGPCQGRNMGLVCKQTAKSPTNRHGRFWATCLRPTPIKPKPIGRPPFG